jgi:hypothetical protein
MGVRRSVVLLVALMMGVAGTAPAFGVGPAKGHFTTSDTCGSCHKDIYKMWRASSHASSMEDTVFLEGYRETEARQGAAVSRRCLKCHAPMVEVNGDVNLKEKITWEGVSCDVCHSISSVDTSGISPRIVLDVGPVKRGPIEDAASMAHEVLFSPLHKGPLICAGCHEYANPDGAAIITTYSEFKESPASREGGSCQSCHMSRTKADVVDPRVKRVAGSEVNLHQMPGGHSLEQLQKALSLKYQAKREGDTLSIEVSLTNKGAGHAVPTGMPGRKVILEVRAQAGGEEAHEERRIYSKVFKDAQGSVITRDSAYFAAGVRLHTDRRIRPGETRVEVFKFPAPAGESVALSVKLHYEHAPTGGTENRTWITFQSESRTLLPAKSQTN